MRNVINVLVLAATAAFSATAVSAQSCSSETLKGDYAFRVSGEIFAGTSLIYRDGIALTSFDGSHLLTQVDYVLANGVPVAGPTDANGFHTDETGTYSVNENCTGQAEINFPTPPGGTSGAVLKLFFVISDDGRELNTAVPANIHSDAVRVHSDHW
jgi:hypothetical protein